MDEAWLTKEAARTRARLSPRLHDVFGEDIATWRVFDERLSRHLPRLLGLLRSLYGDRYDFFWHLEQILATAAASWRDRPVEWKAADRDAEAGPPWYGDHREVGAVAYVDLFAGDLAGLRDRLADLSDLGVTYLHLMPLLRARDGENDGGYAVSTYREVDPRLGTMAELGRLAADLRAAGIRLCLDLVLNHTADDHVWAMAAKQGDEDRRDYYRTYPDRILPDRYRPHLREIFPDRGSDIFRWVPELGRHVWSTFYPFQWDLDFSNPALFRQMLEEMLFLANQGVGILRLDAVPFIWKEIGTACENLPGAHRLIQAFNALARIAAPALVFKSEAIVHPDEVARYIGAHEAQLSYNPLLMSLLWEALATRDVRLLRHSLTKRFALPPGTAWVNYVRSHDDIGWGFADEDATEIGIDGAGHRRFLSAFYTGAFPGSFASGRAFQENLLTGDARVCGTTASLAGLERALAAGDPHAIGLAVRRILMAYGIVMTIGGIPLIYLGDEVGQLNDDGYRAVPDKASDARWIHRQSADWAARARAATEPRSPAGRILAGMKRLIALRKAMPVFGGDTETAILPFTDPHVFAFRRGPETEPIVVLANVTEQPRPFADPALPALLGDGPWIDLLTYEDHRLGPTGMMLEPYGFLCLAAPRDRGR